MKLVLRAMVAAGYLTQRQADAMPVPRVDVRDMGDNLPTGTYFADWALPEIRANDEVGYSRQTITTTLDSKLQAIARRAVARAPLGSAQVALVAMRPNGDVVAMIGGKDYEKSPFNRATQARRQPGSTFKLFVYLAALKSGMKPEDRVSNLAIEDGSYRPANASGAYSESITLQDAFARSSNVAAVRLFNLVGDEAVIQTARDFGVTSPLAEGDPSLALGTSEMTLLELTAAYAGVAGNAYPVKPRAFDKDDSGWFDWLWNSQDSLAENEHDAIERMLRRAVNQGTGRQAMLLHPNFGKTGTSQDYRDALFIGYAGGLVVGVWVGNDDNTPLHGVTGGTIPARIWRDFMREALGERVAPTRPTPKPDPSGPVQPQDVLDAADIPLKLDGTNLRVEPSGAVLSTEINGVPVEVRVNEDGLRFEQRGTASPRPSAASRATPSP
jgi:penicillin-binding protein 1A